MASKKRNFIKVGQVFESINYGSFEIVADAGWDCVTIRFIKTGYESVATRRQIKVGQVMDRLLPTICGVGFIGGTKHKAKTGRAPNPHYTRWVWMLRRCYDANYQKRMPHYVGCSVCPEWHNFQAYAEWCEENYVEGFELDKDILVEGNRVYSPHTCKFVSHQENSEKATAKMYTLVSPCGKAVRIYNLQKFCREKGLTPGNMHKVLRGERSHHKGWLVAKKAAE